MNQFPIFLSLAGTAPLVVGGGELAAVKARLLLKRARLVEVASDRPSPQLTALINEGRVKLVSPRVDPAMLTGRPLVISASGDAAEDRRVSELARALGIPVNVPDRPELCSFSLPAIVDRGEVTVAIGTSGAAPVLATRLRAMLERELHPRLGDLAGIAREFRDQVAARLPPGARRRAFWERVFGGPAADAVYRGDDAEARRLMALELSGTSARATANAGRVILVGAGPGDPDLLTLKAVRALKSADVILIDNLVGRGVLEHARREAEIIDVGKERNRHSKSQAEINALLVHHARLGRTVVRLKGGDPFIFGRGGEEVDQLRASGIALEVVPGITAATAAAASLQIPLTHRDVARAVTFISGHAAGDGQPDFSHIDFRALKAGGNTLAVYMGVATAGALARALIAADWPPATPVIWVERASSPRERRIAATLDVLAASPERLGLAGPALLICGEVAGLTAAGAITHVASAPVKTDTQTETS